MKIYSKAVPTTTYDELEMAFRMNDFKTYIIATVSPSLQTCLSIADADTLQEKELPKTLTYVNLQGELDKTYQVGFHLRQKPKRGGSAAGWPSSPEENLERLKDAGLPYERGIPKCHRCDGKFGAPRQRHQCLQNDRVRSHSQELS